jgi:glutamate formiminotransferase
LLSKLIFAFQISTMRLIECVPNISEGKDRSKIDLIAAAAAEVEGVMLLDVDPGASTHRTVITIAGEPEKVAEAAFRLIKRASELIDMSKHKGEHPRQGSHGCVSVYSYLRSKYGGMCGHREASRREGWT